MIASTWTCVSGFEGCWAGDAVISDRYTKISSTKAISLGYIANEDVDFKNLGQSGDITEKKVKARWRTISSRNASSNWKSFPRIAATFACLKLTYFGWVFIKLGRQKSVRLTYNGKNFRGRHWRGRWTRVSRRTCERISVRHRRWGRRCRNLGSDVSRPSREWIGILRGSGSWACWAAIPWGAYWYVIWLQTR